MFQIRRQYDNLPSHTYRPWIGEVRESHITDKELLERLEPGPQTPFGIADGGDRVSTIRVQCHYLERLGYLDQTSIDVYERSSRGERIVEDGSAFESEYVPIGGELKLEYEHTAEFGDLLRADTIVEINKEFYRSGLDYEDSSIHEIESVRDARLERLTLEFPRFEPLTKQLAHAVRTFCGHHPFPDANHRTGTQIAHILAKKRGYDLISLIDQDSDGITRAVQTSKILRGLCSNVRQSVEYLWIEDELFDHWDRYFRDLIYDVTPQKRVHSDTGVCQNDRLVSNEKVKLIYELSTRNENVLQEYLQ